MFARDSKRVIVGADFAGYELKEAVVRYLKAGGWEITDVGVTDLSQKTDPDMMYHRVGFRVGAGVSEGTFAKGLAFCGTGMGIHLAAGKCPHVHAAVCESVASALRCATANNCNVLAMGGFYIGQKMGIAMADAFLNHELGEGYEQWNGFYEYHKLGYDECEQFDYAAFKANGNKILPVVYYPLDEEPARCTDHILV